MCAKRLQVIENDKNKKQVTIGFRGSIEYRTALNQEALNRGLKVQPMLEKLIQEQFSTAAKLPPSALTPHEAANVDALLYALRTQNETKLHQIHLMLKPFLGKTEEQPANESPSRRKSA